MQKVSASCQKHRQAEFIAGLDGITITFAAPGVDDSRNAMFRGQTNRVVKWEEAIAGQHCASAAVTGCLQGDVR